MHSTVLVVLALLASAVWANVEKTIFLGPLTTSDTVPATLPPLHQLTPESNVWHTNLSAAFPWAANHATQSATWILLEDLNPGQRYEVRVCWAATVSKGHILSRSSLTAQQPTAFDLDTWSLDVVQSTPALAESLASFVLEHPSTDAQYPPPPPPCPPSSSASSHRPTTLLRTRLSCSPTACLPCSSTSFSTLSCSTCCRAPWCRPSPVFWLWQPSALLRSDPSSGDCAQLLLRRQRNRQSRCEMPILN